ncbi:MAG: hypothetical protein Ct9H300mP11_16180 [Chloroflexota bacterium]|nr:MAG: hypothetical protein Ct9H300mP11_16180 [Chloroflexota bacterium]
MSSRFTEQEKESYYDAEDEIYRAVWDEEGSVHWGVFDDSTGDDFLKAGANLDAMMVAKGRIDARPMFWIWVVGMEQSLFGLAVARVVT